MTDNLTTELREKMTERGVEWTKPKSAAEFIKTTFLRNGWGIEVLERNIGLCVTATNVFDTPEQAIAATLGSELNPDGLPVGLTISDDGSLLNWRGENYVRQAIAATMNAPINEVTGKPFDFNKLADRLDGDKDATLGSEINGETSDGYHTFNELYHHRAVLFSVIVRDHRDKAWKARKHHDGTMYDGMFIVGIETPKGQATYHYDLDPYWKMFDCEEREFAPEWDGHTSDDAIARIAELGNGTLTAEQVREAIEKRFDFDVWVPAERWQAIADELNAEIGGTCEMEIKDNMAESEGTGAVWLECSSCHWQIEFFHTKWLEHVKFCPECGRKIRKAVKR